MALPAVISRKPNRSRGNRRGREQQARIQTRRRPRLESLENRQLLAAAVTGDFNNDGLQDVALGMPDQAVGQLKAAGAVQVNYGQAAGAKTMKAETWHQNSPGVNGSAEVADRFGEALVVGDFNNDGYDDLAIGASQEDLGSIKNAGAVHVLYGSSKGLTAKADQLWHQDSPGVNDKAESGDRFAGVLAVGDFNRDGYEDLAIGIPDEDVGSRKDAGAVSILYGSAKGLTATGDDYWTQNTFGIQDQAESGDRFGQTLGAGDFDGDRFDDLAIGVPGEDLGAIRDAGAVNVLYGGKAGLSSSGDQLWHQDSKNVPGIAESGDQFGSSLAVGDFDGDHHADLAIGVPLEDLGKITNAGGVNVIYGAAGGLSSASADFWSQNTSGIDGVARPHERFGIHLAAADLDGDGVDDLAAAVSETSVGSSTDVGLVNLIYGSGRGLNSIASKLVTSPQLFVPTVRWLGIADR